MRFAALFAIVAGLFLWATIVLMQPLHSAGPMNVSFEEPIGGALITVGAVALIGMGWKRLGNSWSWISCLFGLGGVLLATIGHHVARHPPSDGRSDPGGLMAPTDLSMGLAYGTAWVLVLVGVALLLVRLQKTNRGPA
jgi:hypothetical protein